MKTPNAALDSTAEIGAIRCIHALHAINDKPLTRRDSAAHKVAVGEQIA
jgi:hypothetical protein